MLTFENVGQIEEQIERLCKQQTENKRLEQTKNATEADLAKVCER